MKTFLKWAEERKLDLPVITDTPEEEKANANEDSKRTGYSANYPAAYKHGQYPNDYFAPSKGSVVVDTENLKKSKKK